MLTLQSPIKDYKENIQQILQNKSSHVLEINVKDQIIEKIAVYSGENTNKIVKTLKTKYNLDDE